MESINTAQALLHTISSFGTVVVWIVGVGIAATFLGAAFSMLGSKLGGSPTSRRRF